MKRDLPNLIIAGIHKAATTSLYTYLTSHPDVYGPGKKEIHYFTPIRFNKDIKKVEEYKDFYKNWKNEKYAIDASPSYIYGGKTLMHKMIEILPPHKIIIILRNPVDRFISNYNYLKSKLFIEDFYTLNLFIDKCLEEEKKALRDDDFSRAIMEGRYIDFIPEWIEYYKENFKIIYFEDLVKNTKIVMKELAIWLDIDRTIFEKMVYTEENKTIFVKNKIMHKSALYFNHKFEIFWRKNLKLKIFFRNAYYNLNKKRMDKQNINSEEVKRLTSIYSDSNKKLLTYLKSNDLPLPEWLK
ncbi:Sulfotransferase domain-containing protein [Parafilimonas terrae]|uniref:Sulfotransferase domain-containing protein n=2 Tax=Parafilimonas terrae TaxID=1465490 RepID=A0A1I5Z4U3_9BACT|nr:Sulfotransferase domain-containing protein [Parafilimonas terrae]